MVIPEPADVYECPAGAHKHMGVCRSTRKAGCRDGVSHITSEKTVRKATRFPSRMHSLKRAGAVRETLSPVTVTPIVTVQPAPFVKPHCVLIVAAATVLLIDGLLSSYRCTLAKTCKHVLCFPHTVWLNCYRRFDGRLQNIHELLAESKKV